jgi:hypothetical protein
MTYKDRFDLLRHAEQVHDKRATYLCITCDESFDTESSFKMHAARNHKIF